MTGCVARGSLLFTGPMFAAPVEIEMGEVVTRDGFVFADCYLRDELAKSG